MALDPIEGIREEGCQAGDQGYACPQVHGAGEGKEQKGLGPLLGLINDETSPLSIWNHDKPLSLYVGDL